LILKKKKKNWIKYPNHPRNLWFRVRAKQRERERERENTNEKDMSQTKKERKARDGCFPLSKGMRN
jgi:hypothetical protein